MDLTIILKMRLYVLKNVVKKISILKLCILFAFCVSVFLILYFFSFNNVFASAKNTFEEFTLNSVIVGWAFFNGYLYIKTLIGKSKLKIRGVYSFILGYFNERLDKLYLYFLLDKVLLSLIVVTLLISLTCKFSIDSFLLLARISLMIILISFSDFFSKMFIYITSRTLKRNSIVLLNLLLTVMCLILNSHIKLLLIIIVFLVNSFVYRTSKYNFKSYYENKVIIIKNSANIYIKIYTFLKIIFINKKIAFVSSKELVQVYIEKIPLLYSVAYGVVIFLIVPAISLQHGFYEVYIFAYFISVSYSLVGISLNLCARDFKKEWIYKLYKISSIDILIGKFISFFIYAVVINIFYYCIYKIFVRVTGNSFINNTTFITAINVALTVSTTSYFVGGILGSYFVPRLKYKYGSIDYSYNGAEILVLLVTVYIVSLPAYLYYVYFSKNLIAILILFTYQVLLFKLLLCRISRILLKRSGGYGK